MKIKSVLAMATVGLLALCFAGCSGGSSTDEQPKGQKPEIKQIDKNDPKAQEMIKRRGEGEGG